MISTFKPHYPAGFSRIFFQWQLLEAIKTMLHFTQEIFVNRT